MNSRGSTTVADRIFASLPYLLPLIDGLGFGRYWFQEFPPLKVLILPLVPVLQIYSLPFAGLIIFFALYFLVVRSENTSHFVRFNTMQAILIDIVIIMCRLIVSIMEPTFQSSTFIVETLYNTIFLGVLASVIYSVFQSLLGRYAEIPAISEAVNTQIR
ncbi:MAG TPA: hypothetical protein DCY88_07680 [Cyanobacteria bacterium UBA11372]|nr:hypothetical protein [Cyanobacteria bacterium UBA11372]HBE31768.1 hypothetical protein [Cyanobacteria bacterium UBA11368]HBE53804.1 hypothetical protein [Cyanobacteria bacterium UBA11369]